MSERNTLRVVQGGILSKTDSPSDGAALSSEQIVIGKDVLELLSTSMYVDPMTIYREYVQNAADSIDAARAEGVLRKKGDVAVTVDAATRTIKIRDNGIGVTGREIAVRLCSLGASVKRGAGARGFRGVGRLAGLGYCQELIFRTRATGDVQVSELRWDCRRLKAALRATDGARDLRDVVREVVSIHRVAGTEYPERFFEVEMKGVVRHRNDRLLSSEAVASYLSQVAPLPFAPEFRFGGEISAMLQAQVRLGELDLRINGADEPLYRPHRNRMEIGEGRFDDITDLQMLELLDIDGAPAAIGWVAHHGYVGGIPSQAGVKGLRLRVGNIQIGDNTLLEELFPEPRFNGWAVGEIHVIDPRILPNGRRDHFEQSVHLDNAINQLTPVAREIARRCRKSSIARKYIRDFELHEANVLERAKQIARGGMTRAARKVQADAIAKSLGAMRRITGAKNLDAQERESFIARLAHVNNKVSKLTGAADSAEDPLAHFRPEARSAVQKVISLIYEYSLNRAVATSLVDRILSRLETASKAGAPSEVKRNKRKRRKAKLKPSRTRRKGRLAR